jgi:hypothetical protein
MSDGARQYVLRARFQPFCRDHYEAILSFFLEFARDKKDPPHLHLWIVRHVETLANSAGIQSVCSHDIKELCRHLIYFNPLRLDECITGIRQGIHHYVGADLKRFAEAGEPRKVLEVFIEWSATHLHACPVRISVNEMGEFWGNLDYTKRIPDGNYQTVPADGFVARLLGRSLPLLVKVANGRSTVQTRNRLNGSWWIFPVYSLLFFMISVILPTSRGTCRFTTSRTLKTARS